MKLNKLVLIPLTALLLVGCAEQPSDGNVNTNTSTQTSEATTDEEITLKMMGGVYENGFRTIYAFLKNGTDSEIGWKSSNEEVAIVTPRDGLSSEGNVIVRGHGKTTITAYLEDFPGNKASIELDIKKGEPMPEALFDTLKGSITVNSYLRLYDYDKDLNAKEVEKYKITTKFEEIEDFENDPNKNTTDGFYFQKQYASSFKNVYDPVNLVRSNTGYVSKELRNINNEVRYEKVKTEEFPDGEKWAGTVNYKNPFMNLTAYNDSFESFDGGKTYHFIAGSDFAENIVRGLFIKGASPDDVYFKVLDDNQLELHIVFDPYNKDINQKVRYGSEYVSTFSDHGTTKVDHVELFKEEPYHADIKTAIDKLKKHNYTVKFKLDYPGFDHDYYTETQYDENNVFEVKTDLDGNETSYSGLHKFGEDSTIYYWKEEVDGKDVVFKKQHEEDIAKKFPTFYFSPLIFEKTSKDNEYVTIDDMGTFIAKIMKLPDSFTYLPYEFDKGYITLNEQGNIATARTTAVDKEDNESVTIEATFRDVGTTEIVASEVDFDKMEFKKAPANWIEYGGGLYQSLKDWKIDTILPFLYPANGFESTGVYPADGNDHVGYIKSRRFSLPDGAIDEVARDAYIAQYIEILHGLGYKESEEVFKDKLVTVPLLVNDNGYMIGIAKDNKLGLNIGGGGLGGLGGIGKPNTKLEDDGTVRIVIQSSKISKPL